MAIVVTDLGQANSTIGGTCLLTVLASVPTGALIVVCVTDRSNPNNGTPSVTDVGSNTYAGVAQTKINNAATSGFGEVFYSYNSTALVSGVSVITYTKAETGKDCAITAFYATGILSTGDPYDSAVLGQGTGNSTTPTATSGTPSVAGELFLALYSSAGNTGTYTPDTGHSWATPPITSTSGTASTNSTIAGGTQVNAGTGTIIHSPTTGTSHGWADIIVGFKPTPAGGSLFLTNRGMATGMNVGSGSIRG